MATTEVGGPRNRLVGTVHNVVYKGGLSDVAVLLADGSEMRVGLAAGERRRDRMEGLSLYAGRQRRPAY